MRVAPPLNVQHTVGHGLLGCVNIFRAYNRLTKLCVNSEAVERHVVFVSDFMQLGRIRQIQKRSERGALWNTGF